MAKNSSLVITVLYFLVLNLFCLDVPFFWDGTFFSSTALQFYNEGFGNLLPALSNDSGGFPLYSAYLAVCWKIAGSNLFVSHLAFFPVIAGICVSYHRLAGKFLAKEHVKYSMILLMAEPVLSTQSVLMGYDLFMVWFFLLALNAMLEKRWIVFAICTTLLCLSSMRGILLMPALLLTDILLLRSRNIRAFAAYVPAILAVAGWACYHYFKTGWFFISPLREDTHESLLGPSMMLRQLLFAGWKLADCGHVALWLIVGTLALRSPRSDVKRILLIVLACTILTMVPLANPVGPKYFICIFLLLNIAVVKSIAHISSAKKRLTILGITAVVLVSGNFWMYPLRFGNSWDSSLKVLSYFDAKAKMDRFVQDNSISAEETGTQFPLIASSNGQYLNDLHPQYINVWQGPVENFRYILESNVINSDIPEQFLKVHNSWKLIHSERSGQVYLNLYERPI